MKKNNSTKKTPRIPLALRLLRLCYQYLGPIFPVYFGHRAFEQWFTTTRFKRPAYEKPALASANRETIHVNNLNIAVYLWQHKSIKPKAKLLFIHGWSGRGTQIVHYIQALNNQGYQVISFDGPAHGNSAGRQTSLLEMTDVVLTMEKHYGHFDAAITHSFGGMILLYAMRSGLTLDRAALICPAKNFQVILENLQRILALPDSVMQAVKRKTSALYGQVTQDAINTVHNAKHIHCKGLLIHDEDDLDIPWQNSEEIANAWSGAQFVKTSGLGHRRILQDEKVRQRILHFLQPET